MPRIITARFDDPAHKPCAVLLWKGTSMKKTTSTIAALAVSAAIGITAGAQTGELTVLGDSIASGYGLPGYAAGDNYSAPDSFANLLAADFSGCRNFAVDGRTSGQLLETLEDDKVSEALAGAEVVVVSIGGNDYLQPMAAAVQSLLLENEELMQEIGEGMEGGVSGDSFDADKYLDIMREFTKAVTDAADSVDAAAVGANIRSVLNGINALNPDCRTIILTVYDPFEGVAGMELIDVTAREKLAELNSEIASAADECGADVADVFTAFKGHAVEYTNISSMDIHPNKAGHAVIRSLLSELVSPAAEVMQPADAGASGDSGRAVSSKGSPDTGAEGISLFAGAAVIAAAAAVLSRRR